MALWGPGLLAVTLAAPILAVTGPVRADEPIRVVASTTVLADLVAQAGGDLVTVSSLVPKGGEVHTFDPSPEDAVTLARADLVVMNGLGLDDWLRKLVADTGASGVPIVALGEDLVGVDYLAGEPEEGAVESPATSDGGAQGVVTAPNPHVWMDVAYAMKYVEKLTAALEAVDPGHAAAYEEHSAAYLGRLSTLDAEIATVMDTVPPERRTVVSFHDAFPYFAAAYGLRIVGTVIRNPGQEPSAADVAALIDTIRREGVSAIFAETQFPNDLADVIGSETGVPVVTGLYDDTLGDPPVDTYEGMMRTDARLVVDALR